MLDAKRSNCTYYVFGRCERFPRCQGAPFDCTSRRSFDPSAGSGQASPVRLSRAQDERLRAQGERDWGKEAVLHQGAPIDCGSIRLSRAPKKGLAYGLRFTAVVSMKMDTGPQVTQPRNSFRRTRATADNDGLKSIAEWLKPSVHLRGHIADNLLNPRGWALQSEGRVLTRAAISRKRSVAAAAPLSPTPSRRSARHAEPM